MQLKRRAACPGDPRAARVPAWGVPCVSPTVAPQALPGGILPIMLNDHYGPHSYVIVGYAQSLKGMLAFIAAPAIGALSDVVGRKHLFLTCVLGTATLAQHVT